MSSFGIQKSGGQDPFQFIKSPKMESCPDFEFASCPHKSSNTFCLLKKKCPSIRMARKDSGRELTGLSRGKFQVKKCVSFFSGKGGP